MPPDIEPDPASDTVDVDAGSAATIDRAIGAADPIVATEPTRATRDVEGPGAPVRRRRSRTSALPGLGAPEDAPTLDDDPGRDTTAEAALPAGTVLAGRYRLGERVGQGGMGTVYAARDTDLDEDVALKLLRAELARDEGYRARLRGEVRLARRVSHPNVCRVHDLGVAGDHVFVTMELVRGRTLRQLLADMRAGRLPAFDLAQVVDLLVQVGSALTAAHRAGVIHRDVKPDNIILTDGRAVLTDFGVATRSADRAEAVAGTPAYLAPEVLRHEPFDHKVDVYALAVVAFELLGGKPPYPARSVEAATEIAMVRPPYPGLPIALADAEVRGALDRVLARGLAGDPLLRTPSIDRFTEALAVAARTAATPPGLGAVTAAIAPARPLDGTPPTGVAAIGTEASGSPSSPPATRRPEVRVATALAWRRPPTGPVAPATDPASRPGGDASGPIDRVERIVVDAGGTPIRVTGHDLVALFGVPRSLGDDAERAARAALTAVAAHGGAAGLDTTRVQIRSGVAELPGVEVAHGAAALAAAATADEVVASAATARQLAARFDLAAPEPARTAARRILGVRAVAPPAAITTYRARELATLAAHLERAFRERTPVFVEVRGGPGTGKTRLRDALVAAVGERREVEWLAAVASPLDTPAPLTTLATASREWRDAAAVGDPARRHDAARRWLEARAARRPVAVLVDDAQWADPSTRQLLDQLRAGLAAVPVAIVTFARTEDDAPDGPPPPGIELVRLGPLDDAQAAAVASALAPEASATAIADVVARAAGNPFFVEELARELADGGAATLPPSVEAMVQTRLDHLPELAAQVVHAAAVIGRTFARSAVAAVVAAPDELLDAALAELGRRGLCAVAAATGADDVRYRFAQGLVRDVAYARIPPRERQELHAAVATWLERRAARAGDSLQPGPWSPPTEPGASRPEPPSREDLALALDAAYHREQAGDTAGAAAAYRRAGVRCLAVFAYGEAASALRRARALVGPRAEAALHEELGDALIETAGPSAAEDAYRDAMAALARADGPDAARLYDKLAFAASRRADPATAIERYRAGLAIAAPGAGALATRALAEWAQRDPRVAARLLGGLGWTLGYQLGKVDDGHPLCERAVALLDGTPHRRELAQALGRLGGTYMRACRFADQLRTNQRNLEIGRELGDLDMQLTAQINLGVTHGLVGELDLAIASTAAGRALALRIGAAATAGLATSNLAGLLVERGDLAAAEDAIDEALELVDRTGHRYVLCETYAFSARLHAARGDLAAARHHAERSRVLARELGSAIDVAVAARLCAAIAARAGDHAEAAARIAEALAAAAGADVLEHAKTRAAYGRILRAAGDPAADGVLAEARAALTRLGAARELAVLDRPDEVR